jgi:dolichol-phosphate mannosyltransferase
MSGKTLVFIPTYNERENAEKICIELLGMKLGVDLLFLDDASPDGTGKRLDELAAREPRLKVIHRASKLGVGSAHRDGIHWAYENGYSTLITMDCDFTHPPHYIPAFLSAAADGDVVVGSRYMRPDSLEEWSLFRWLLTRLGHVLTRHFLDMPYDATGAFRLYRLDRVPQRLFAFVESTGYSFFFESLYVLHRNGLSITEVPITLPARTYGTSKMRTSDILNSVSHLVRLYASQRWSPERPREPDGNLSGLKAAANASSPEWDRYWADRQETSGAIFGMVASLYRIFIIKRALNIFVRESFCSGSELLHAGCGSGQVDIDVTKTMKVTALDISLSALGLHDRANAGRAKLVHGDLFAVPLPDQSFDGIYNLGVMEHFSVEDIHKILVEFRRLLRPGGKVLSFWPPSFGISVITLDSIHFVLNRIFKMNMKLHPDEITRVRSPQQIRDILEKAGFEMTRFYFGPRDFFTHSVIVGVKKYP